jgi:class 3 adenylate cyclase/CHASE1-domain containing sensor protein
MKVATILLIGLSLAAIGGIVFVFVSLYQWRQTSTDEAAIKGRFVAAVSFFGGQMRDDAVAEGSRLAAAGHFCGALVSRAVPVDNASFAEFVGALGSSASGDSNETVSLVWAPAVMRGMVAEHEAEVRRLNGPAFRNYSHRSAWSGGETSFPLVYVGPAMATIASSAGIDILDNAARRATIEQAIATRARTVTGLVSTVRDRRPAVVMYEPVFARNNSLAGVAYAVLLIDQFVAAPLVGMNVSNAQIQVVDVTANDTSILYLYNQSAPHITDEQLASNPLAASFRFPFAQRQWRIDMYSFRPADQPVPVAAFVILPLTAIILLGAIGVVARYRMHVARQERNRQLLSMVVPEHVTSQLISHMKTVDGDVVLRQALVADFYTDVSLCFIDICDFTSISSRLTPRSLVRFLDDLVSTIDAIVARYEAVLKIKTIGDAYFVASGVHSTDKRLLRRASVGGGVGHGEGGDARHDPLARLPANAPLHVCNLVSALMFCFEVQETIQARAFAVELQQRERAPTTTAAAAAKSRACRL